MFWKRVLMQTLGFCIQGYAFEMASRGKPEGMYPFMLIGFAVIIIGGFIGRKKEEEG